MGQCYQTQLQVNPEYRIKFDKADQKKIGVDTQADNAIQRLSEVFPA